MLRSSVGWAVFALAAIFGLNVLEAQLTEREPAITPSVILTPLPRGETSPVKREVPQGILDPILKEVAALAKVTREQLVIVRAEPVVWNDGSLGCPEPGMGYAQTLVNGYWVVISAAGQTYDFRVGRDGSFRLCPAGRGHPPLPSDAS
jgi:hypothetical protein